MSVETSPRKGTRVVTVVTAVGIVALAAGGFVLSFDALRDLAERSGTQPRLAWIWPLTVDGFIVVATVAAFSLARAGRRVTWYPWAALMLFAVISVTGNALHAINNEDALRVATPIAVMVSSIPAIALLVASHFLVVLVGYWTRDPDEAPVAAVETSPAADTSVSVPAAAATQAADHVLEDPAPQIQLVPTEPVAITAPAVQPPTVTKPERLEAIKTWLAEDPEVQSASIAKRFGLSDRTARRDLSEARTLLGEV